jgi:hypothetical protein
MMNVPVFIKRMIFGGSGRLAATELKVVEALSAKLSDAESLAIKEQLREIETVQKHSDRIISISYRSGAVAPLLPDGEYCLAKLRLEEERRKSSVSVWSYGGRLRSIEYSRRPRSEFSILECEVRPAKAVSTAAAIDRLDHPHEERG